MTERTQYGDKVVTNRTEVGKEMQSEESEGGD